jgi:hypothetical protein
MSAFRRQSLLASRLTSTSIRSLVILPAVLAACSRSTRGSPPGVPDPAGRDSTPISVPSSSMGIYDIYQPGTVRYDYRFLSAIVSVAGDSIPRTDSSRITATLLATFSGDVQKPVTDVTVKADSILVVQLGVSELPVYQTQFIQSRFDRTTGQVVKRPAEAADCTLGTSDLIFRGDEILPAVKRDVSRTSSWADTTVSISCRGGIPLQVTRIARYRVDPAQMTADDGGTIIRATDIGIVGTGSQWQQPVEVTGTGAAIDTLVMAGTPPRVQQIKGQSRVSLEFRSASRNQRFLQTSTTSIVARTPSP